MSKNDARPTETKTDPKQTLDSPFDKPIISVKEARKLLGKKVSDQLPDEEVGRLIGDMSFLANRLLEIKSVPQNEKVI